MGEKPIIGIIGGNGAMGRWFTRFFKERGHEVLIHDRDTSLTLAEVSRRASVVVVSVPIDVTCEVIRQAGPYVGRECLLTDLTSLKASSVKAMLEHSAAEVVGMHPLFGPDVSDMQGQNVILCPARGERWRSWLRNVFTEAGAVITETTPEKHDEMMAVVQGMNHLNTIIMELTLREVGVNMENLTSFTTPVFRTKLDLIKRILAQDTSLIAEIIGGNPHLLPVFEAYGKNWKRLHKLLEKRDIAGIKNLLENLKGAPFASPRSR